MRVIHRCTLYAGIYEIKICKAMKTLIILSLITVGFTSIQANENTCPPEKDIYPCFCDTDKVNFSSVFCEKTTVNNIKVALQASRGRNVSFSFNGIRFAQEISSDFFQGQISNSLTFDHCKIGSFGGRPFSGLDKTLTNLDILFSIDKKVKDLQTFPLSHLKKLRSLNFEGNDITRIWYDWFADGPESLRYVSLQANDIEILHPKAFTTLVNLEQIWLGDNRFKVIQRSMFPRPARNLNLIEMSFNGIKDLPSDIFDDMPVLDTINVSGNPITTLLESTWGKVWNQLKEVYVGRSNLVCDEKIKWIFQRKLPKIFSGTCGSKKLEDMTIEDFD